MWIIIEHWVESSIGERSAWCRGWTAGSAARSPPPRPPPPSPARTSGCPPSGGPAPSSPPRPGSTAGRPAARRAAWSRGHAAVTCHAHCPPHGSQLVSELQQPPCSMFLILVPCRCVLRARCRLHCGPGSQCLGENAPVCWRLVAGQVMSLAPNH